MALGFCQSHYDTWRHYGRAHLIRPEQRFWSKVQKGGPDECWPWTGAVIGGSRYGKIWWRNRVIGAHRVSYEIAHDVELRREEVVRHTCDNPPCVNPAHLLLGTQLDNVLDMVEREHHTAGERSGTAKITWSDVYRIRQLDAEGFPQVRIAEMTGVHKNSVWQIIHRQSWRD